MRVKKVLGSSVLLSLILLSTACSNGGTTATTQGNTKDKMYDISFMNFAYTIFPPAQGKAVDAIKEKFHANIKAQFIPNADFDNKLSVVMASGDMPDVVAIENLDSNYYKWAKQGAFLPLDDYIQKYGSFKAVPKTIYDQFRVNGHIYSIPMYAPTYSFVGLIRQDWLDKLGLKMPTNYDELLKVAIAFTKDHPDGNNNTYGIALSQNISPDYSQGAYWSGAWYFKNKDGQLIPGVIGPGRKQIIQMLHDAYAQGAVTKDFAVLNWQQTNKEFYSGKAGIFIGTPVGMVEDYFTGLMKAHPEAKLAPIPIFKAPDGSQGMLNGPGFFGLSTLSAKLKNQPDKVAKILEIMDYGRQFIPMNERTPDNKRFDWLMGGVGVGYDMVNGQAVLRPGSESVTPIQYMLQRHEFWKPWAPNNEANEYDKTYKTPEMQKLIKTIEDMYKEYNKTPYDDPTRGIFSETQAQKGKDLDKYITDEQTKMITGQRPISDWDKLVQEWMDRGGAQIIKEINEGVKERQGGK